jgi:anti-anti-sigma regulatory factor
LIIDVTGVEVMDGADFDGLRRTIDVVALLGTRTVLCGRRQGVAAACRSADKQT